MYRDTNTHSSSNVDLVCDFGKVRTLLQALVSLILNKDKNNSICSSHEG